MATLNVISKYSTAQVFAVGFDRNPATLIVDANGGSVLIEVQLDTATDAWVTHSTISADGIHKLEANGCNVRFTPSGAAEYAFVRP